MELHPPHRAWAEATSKECPSSQDSSGRRQARKRQADLPGVGFPLPRGTEWGPPRRNLGNSTKSQERRDLQIIFSPQNSELDILQGMSRHFESSSPQKFTSVFSFAACPSPAWYSHCGHGPGISKPSRLDQTEDRSVVCVSHRNGQQWVEEASLERRWRRER